MSSHFAYAAAAMPPHAGDVRMCDSAIGRAVVRGTPSHSHSVRLFSNMVVLEPDDGHRVPTSCDHAHVAPVTQEMRESLCRGNAVTVPMSSEPNPNDREEGAHTHTLVLQLDPFHAAGFCSPR